MSGIERAVVFLGLVGAAACAAPDHVVCAGTGLGLYTQPQDTTIAVGQSFVATAGAIWETTCTGAQTQPPARLMVWNVSDSTIVSLVARDSIHVLVAGVQPGTTTVTPRYENGGGAVSAVHVLVTK